jgi:hypothetical protein
MRQIALERWGIYDQLERSINDPTGATPMPLEVTGVPLDKVQMMLAAQQQAVAQAAGGAPGNPPPTDSTATPAPGTLVSPSPINSPVMTEASKLPSPELTPEERGIAGGQT